MVLIALYTVLQAFKTENHLCSVMDSLPPTSYVRMVDIWLIVFQIVPFLEVVTLTMKEIYYDQDKINHHGRERDVSNEDDEAMKIEDEITRMENIYKVLSRFGKFQY